MSEARNRGPNKLYQCDKLLRKLKRFLSSLSKANFINYSQYRDVASFDCTYSIVPLVQLNFTADFPKAMKIQFYTKQKVQGVVEPVFQEEHIVLTMLCSLENNVLDAHGLELEKSFLNWLCTEAKK